MRRLAFLILSILISLVLLFLVLRDLPMGEIWAALSQADLFWTSFAIINIVLGLFLRGIRWRSLLENRLSIREAFLIINLTFLLNQLPFRLGEVARSFLAKQRNIPLVTAATSIVVERLLDTFLVVLLVAWSVSQIPNIDPQVTQGALIFGIFAILGFGFLLLLAHFPQLAHKILALIEKIPLIKKLALAQFLENILAGLQALSHWPSLAQALLWTILAWGTSLLGLYACLRALSIEEAEILLTSLGMGLSSLSIAIPASVAGIGLIEGAFRVAGSILAVDDIQATALGFLYHGLTVAIYLLMGIPSAWGLGFIWQNLFKRKNSD